jgi:serine/threonine protein kinase
METGAFADSARPGKVHFQKVVLTMLELASALKYLHALGILHCDLKPGNVLLMSKGQVRWRVRNRQRWILFSFIYLPRSLAVLVL